MTTQIHNSEVAGENYSQSVQTGNYSPCDMNIAWQEISSDGRSNLSHDGLISATTATYQAISATTA